MSFKSSKMVDILKQEDRVQLVSIEITPNIKKEELAAIKNTRYISISWRAKCYPNPDLDIPPIRLATLLREKREEVLLHLPCDQLKKDYLDSLLKYLQEKDICNLFVVLGDGFNPLQSDFGSTTDLIVYIRKKTKDYFCIGVVAYIDDFMKLTSLKTNVMVGANFVITQPFFEYHVYQHFLQVLENRDIEVPVIPCMFLFETYQQLTAFSYICKVKISKSFLHFVKSPNGNEISGLRIMEKLMADIINNRCFYVNDRSLNIHIVTMDRVQNVYRILTNFELE